MKKFFKRLHFLSVCLALVLIFFMYIYLISTEKWTALIKLFLFTCLGFAISHFEIFDTLVWKWKKIYKNMD